MRILISSLHPRSSRSIGHARKGRLCRLDRTPGKWRRFPSRPRGVRSPLPTFLGWLPRHQTRCPSTAWLGAGQPKCYSLAGPPSLTPRPPTPLARTRPAERMIWHVALEPAADSAGLHVLNVLFGPNERRSLAGPHGSGKEQAIRQYRRGLLA